MPKQRSSAKKIADLFDLAPDPVYLLDADRLIVFCNQACGQWVGLLPEELVGRRVDYHSAETDIAPPGLAAGLCPPPAAFSGEEVLGHVSCMSADGRLHYRRARFVPLGGQDQEQVGVIAFVTGGDLNPFQLEKEIGGDPAADALHLEIRRFRTSQGRRYAIPQLLGRSPAIEQARAQILVAAECRCATTIVGQPGTGRSHVARTIHYRATQTEGRLVPLDCGLFSGEALRATLTGIVREETDSPASLLLQNVSALAEEQQFLVAELFDSASRLPLVLSTAAESLLRLAERGEFRRDLACRLSTLEIRLPPLRERLEDLPLLGQFFLEEENRAGRKQVGGIARESLDLLLLHKWPGNLDELAETIRAGHRAATGPLIGVADLPSRLHFAAQAAQYPRPREEPIVLEEVLAQMERSLIEQALARAGGNKTRAARLLGLNRPRFYRRLEQLGMADRLIDSSEFELDENASPGGGQE